MAGTNLQRTRIKICGITSTKDLRLATQAGADAIGLVFYPPSPRHIDLDRAAEIIDQLPAFVTSVALFVNPAPSDVEAVLKHLSIDLLQFHGSEDEAFCRQFESRYIKALPMNPDVNIKELIGCYSSASAILLDAYHPEVPGGTGESFDWDRIPKDMDSPLILAGGLNPNNICKAVKKVAPFAVDVSSGVEAEKGVKDSGKIAQFIRGVQQADAD